MTDNPCYENCVNRSPARSPTREQCLAMQSVSGDVDGQAFQIEDRLNKVYEKRLAEINKEANGDASLKEITYLEWIATLRQINTTLITNIQHMENETSERLALLQRKVGSNCRHGQDNELYKCRKDMAGLMQLVRNGKHSGDWTVEKYNFETITKQDIFGNEADCCGSSLKYDTVECSKQLNTPDPRSCAVQKSKLIANVKALAVEVADKHDEIRELKKQILSMEDEIQKAQKKIQLKDDVIRELRNDLKSLPKCPSVVGGRTSDRTTPTPCCLPMSEVKPSELSGMDSPTTPRPSGCYSARDSINSLTCNPLEGIFGTPISLDVDEEEEFIKCLKEELNQVFDIRQSYDQNIEEHKRLLNEQQKNLNDYIDKLLKMNGNFQKKLRFYRHELLNLENSQCSDMDSGISSDCDPDLKILNSVRNRLGCLIEENQVIKKEEQTMQIKFQDASSREKAKTELLDKTSNALQQVANALSHAICKPIAYDIIFGNCPNTTDNPLVDAVNELLEILKKREETIAELKTQIANNRKVQQELGTKSQELRHELSDLKHSISASSPICNCGYLFQNQDFSRQILQQAEKYQEDNSGTQQQNHTEYLRIIDDLSTELNTLSHQVNMVQSEFATDEIAQQFDSSLKVLEAQNDLLQGAVESLIEDRATIERTLHTQNEDLKSRLCQQEEDMCILHNKIAELQQRPCERCATRDQAECTPRDVRRRTTRTDSAEELQRLEYELRKKGKAVESLKSENSKLLDELAVISRSQAKMKLLQRRDEARNERQPNEHDLKLNLHAVEEKNRDQSKCLQKAAKEIDSLRQEIETLRSNQDTFSKERDLLQTELIALKESQAAQCGVQQSLREQLEGALQELYVAKQKQHECMQAKDRTENLHRDQLRSQQDVNAKILTKFNDLVDDYNILQQEYRKIVEIEQEKSKQLKAFQTWKYEQIQNEKDWRKKVQLLETHVKDILEDNQNLLDRLNQTGSDNRILMEAMQQSRSYSIGNQLSSVSSPGSRQYTIVGDNDPVSKVIENVRSTSRRLSNERYILEDAIFRNQNLKKGSEYP